jgi:hypothetical protein
MTGRAEFDPRSPVAVARFATLGVPPAARRFALAGDTALWAHDRTLVVAGPRRDPVRLDAPFAVERLEIHPDGRHGLCIGGEGRRLAVYDLVEPALAFELGSADAPRHSMQTGFGRLAGAPLLLAAHKKGELHGYDLAKRAPIFWVNAGAPLSFRVEATVALAGDRLAILGHHFSDTLDTLAVVPTADLAGNPEALETALIERTGIRDSAVRLAAGPCGDAIVVFRDPENNEDRDPDDDDPPGELEGFRGVYLRALAGGALVGRIDHDAPIETGARIGGNARWLAVECPTRVDIIDRATSAVHALTGDAVALDPHRLRIARATGDAIELFDLGA